MPVTPGEATYVIERLINERRLTATDITHYLDDLQRDITTTAERLAHLRAALPSHTNPIPSNTRRHKRRSSNAIASNTPSSNALASNTIAPNARRKRRFSPAACAQQQLHGRYMGYLRQVATHIKPRFQATKAREGINAAITALKQHLGK